ncbi:transaldolase family protein [Dongia sp.]|uniref:transaldolase family protein n=1 Tax=Dongia sp. TaxID=1977262 RepID=UPI0035B2073D
MTYRLFIDSATAADWRVGLARGWLHGVTTNPLILSKAGGRVDLPTAAEIVGLVRELGIGELQLQATGHDAAGLLASGKALRHLWHGVTVKVPATAAGFEAAATLCRDGVPVTITACYTAHQTMLAASIGAHYVAPYYGRMLDAGIDADGRLDAMQSIAARQGNLRVLVASIRSLDQLETLTARGFDTFTLTPALAAAVGIDPQSDGAAADFMKAAENTLK